MKIKTVCEITSLSDRTIRFYIEEGLITPKYTENYLGRKKFDFSEQDIETLKQIAVLRSFDFSVDEIRKIIRDCTQSKQIIDAVQQRTKKTMGETEEKLAVLMGLDADRNYTVPQLAAQLLCLQANDLPKQEKAKFFSKKKVISTLKKVLIFLTVWWPIVTAAYYVFHVSGGYKYPKYNLWLILAVCLSLLPSVLVLIGAGSRFWKRKVVKIILLCLCLLLLPVGRICAVFSATHSETTHCFYYRDFESSSSIHYDLLFQELFPVEKLSADSYYYRYEFFLAERYEVYAQWEMRENAFSEEVARVTGFLEENVPETSGGAKEPYLHKEQRGTYTCYILFVPSLYEYRPDTITYADKYYVFAYDPSNLQVRYIHCSGFNAWDERTYCAELNW